MAATTVTNNFTAVGNGPAIAVLNGRSYNYSVSGTFVGTWIVEYTLNAGQSWVQVATGTGTVASTSASIQTNGEPQALVRFRCSAYTSGTVETSIGESSTVASQSWEDTNGDEVLQITEGGVNLPGTLGVTGAVTLSSTLSVTGAVALSAALNQTKGADIASAATINLDTATGNYVNVTGTTTISTITLTSGRQRWVRFADALQLTHGSSLIIPTAANVTTEAGDYALFIGDSTNVARLVSYFRASSFPATLARAETLTNKTLTAPVIATIVSGGGTSTLPTSTDTLVGRATTDTLTNKTLTSPVVNEPVMTRTARTILIPAGALGKAGATAGWVVAAGDNVNLATVPQNQTGSTMVVPIPGLKVGDIITGFHLIGQIDSAGNTVTLDADLRKQTAAAAGVTDASLGTMTQVSVTADTALTLANTTKTLAAAETVAADETFYALLTATTGATTDVEIQGIAIIVTEK